MPKLYTKPSPSKADLSNGSARAEFQKNIRVLKSIFPEEKFDRGTLLASIHRVRGKGGAEEVKKIFTYNQDYLAASARDKVYLADHGIAEDLYSFLKICNRFLRLENALQAPYFGGGICSAIGGIQCRGVEFDAFITTTISNLSHILHEEQISQHYFSSNQSLYQSLIATWQETVSLFPSLKAPLPWPLVDTSIAKSNLSMASTTAMPATYGIDETTTTTKPYGNETASLLPSLNIP